jgi:hypothetical protein
MADDPRDELRTLFAFEQDFRDELPCLPMAVRFKLDACGIKLSLKEWNKLAVEERRALLDHPGDDLGPLAARLTADVRARTGQEPARFEPPAEPAWRAAAPPPEVALKAEGEGLALTDAIWSALTPLERFALCKLSRPRHTNENFGRAAREFGVPPRTP